MVTLPRTLVAALEVLAAMVAQALKEIKGEDTGITFKGVAGQERG